jgi:alpha,alpha-trehalase
MTRRIALTLLFLALGCRAPERLQAGPQGSDSDRRHDSPAAPAAEDTRSPSELYGELFIEVQTRQLFPDSKTFVDAIARRSPADIMDRYQVERSHKSFDLRRFVQEEFELPQRPESDFQTAVGTPLRDHIRSLWPILTRAPDTQRGFSSRLPLPFSYVVPGGRFDELYYWDSYFTMLGLEADGRHGEVRSLCKNFMHLVERYGRIPNGNRTYYLSRSQPPFLFAMMELIAKRDGHRVWDEFLPVLEREHAFWMAGAENVPAGSAEGRVVRLVSGELLNRYWDDRDTPRDESYREDVETARKSGRLASEVYRNLRAAAESGWDFSSRWFGPSGDLASIVTVERVPVDLNALLYGAELTLARRFAGIDPDKAKRFMRLAQARKAAVQRHHYDEELGAFTDYDWKKNQKTPLLTAATVVPLFVGLADPQEADRVAETIERRLLAPHGLLTTLKTTGEQWDAPNGWAPLVWMATQGLRRYGFMPLAEELEGRFLALSRKKYLDSGKLVEKYDVVSEMGSGGGGEYPLQDGFGWTNGVIAALLELRGGAESAPLPPR